MSTQVPAKITRLRYEILFSFWIVCRSIISIYHFCAFANIETSFPEYKHVHIYTPGLFLPLPHIPRLWGLALLASAMGKKLKSQVLNIFHGLLVCTWPWWILLTPWCWLLVYHIRGLRLSTFKALQSNEEVLSLNEVKWGVTKKHLQTMK